MEANVPPWTWRRFKWALKLGRAGWLEQKGDFERAIELLDEAAKTKALRPRDRVLRARLLLRSQRVPEAHEAFAALREEFKSSSDPDLQYLTRYCTYLLSTLIRSSGQWTYEAKEGQQIQCDPGLKRAFPMTTSDEIWESFKPKS